MKKKEIEVLDDLIAYCLRREAESGLTNGYYRQMVTLFEARRREIEKQ